MLPGSIPATCNEPLITLTTSVSVGAVLAGAHDAHEGARAKRVPSRAARVIVP